MKEIITYLGAWVIFIFVGLLKIIAPVENSEDEEEEGG